jgi:hypothetical protein
MRDIDHHDRAALGHAAGGAAILRPKSFRDAVRRALEADHEAKSRERHCNLGVLAVFRVGVMDAVDGCSRALAAQCGGGGDDRAARRRGV